MDQPFADDFVKISNLSKTFDKHSQSALYSISTDIPKGKIVGLAGPDGAGKTTFIRLVAGLLMPSTGFVEVNGCDTIKQAEDVHLITSYMPQKFGLYEDLTVIQNLELYAELKDVLGEEREKTFEKLLTFTSLKPILNRLAGDLSGGMKQKLGLACALVKKPELLLLDEPSVGVDPVSRRELWKMVQELLKEGITVIWSTAYLDEAERCDTVLLLNEGRLLYQGTPEGLTRRVEGRTFKVSGFKTSRRGFLVKFLREPHVIDAVIQGADIRIVTRFKGYDLKSLEKIAPDQPLTITPTPPRFEDAFIDILGGVQEGVSRLADETPHVEFKNRNVIEAKQITKKFGSFIAANEITFDVKRGEIFGLLGPNGAGKTTTFKMLCGLLRPTHGKAFVNGIDFQEAPSTARAQVGYMAQKFSLYGDLSVWQNLYFFSGVYNLKGNEQLEAINQMVDIFSFEQFMDESAGKLPLGFKQRLALSCAVMHQPKVLFLDEPTSGVDPITRREFWNHINGLVEKGVTVLVTTHFMDEAEYCDRIALVYRGRVINLGSPDYLKEKVKSSSLPNPTLEDAFIELIEKFDEQNQH